VNWHERWKVFAFPYFCPKRKRMRSVAGKNGGYFYQSMLILLRFFLGERFSLRLREEFSIRGGDP